MGNTRRTSGGGGGGGGGEGHFHEAARSGDLQAVQFLCNSNPLSVNSRDKHSRTPYFLPGVYVEFDKLGSLPKHFDNPLSLELEDASHPPSSLTSELPP
ncbi:hypothetical protein Syun_012180 [Stephania yunnanensis]|uniref:Uncharacterized protein n=1 Tax=Stephania yunnanensis TaxID=152371 RepID=A0AAP0PIS6_9MAGN